MTDTHMHRFTAAAFFSNNDQKKGNIVKPAIFDLAFFF